MSDYSVLARELGARLGRKVAATPAHRVHGGCVSEAWRWSTDGAELFVKIAPRELLAALESESAGLEALHAARAVRVPRVRAVGSAGERCFLALEWLTLVQKRTVAHVRCGEQLAKLHATVGSQFGWCRANALGSTLQLNQPAANWTTFFREQRLGFQLALAQRNGYRGELQERGAELLSSMHLFFATHRPEPALLHGDLWGGNWGADSEQQPVIFDPAVYYGDREADIAMTRLFGGYECAFYDAYAALWPPCAGSEVRSVLYNLYHVLNHLNLFGALYLHQAQHMIEQLLAELRA